MGALIFLLLVTTRRIQKQSLLPVVAIEVPQEQLNIPEVVTLPRAFPQPLPTPAVVTPPSTIPDDNEPILPLLAGNSIEENDLLEADWNARQARRKQDYLEKLAQQQQRQTELQRQWNTKKAQLEKDVADIDRRMVDLEAQRTQRLADLNNLQSKLGRSQQELQDALQESQRIEELIEAEQRTRTRLQNHAAELTRQIARLEKEQAQTAAETEIVAYDSLTGTSRKPILIECREKEIIFAAEGVVLSAKELSGFPPEYNPLKAGAEALMNYWTKNGKSDDKPYILLVVRPEGTTGFYVARGLLAKMDHHFGYELIDTDMDLKWPQTDPAAIQACQEAVFGVLSERERVASRIGAFNAKSGPLTYSNEAGEFYLPEMNALNRSKPGNYLGDEKWIPPGRQKATGPLRNDPFAEMQTQTGKSNPDLNITNPEDNPSGKSTTNTSPRLGDTSASTFPGDDKLSERRMIQPREAKIYEFNREQATGKSSDLPLIAPNGDRSQRASTPPAQLSSNPFEPKPADRAGNDDGDSGIRLPPSRSIGIEREVEIHLWPDQFRIDDDLAMKIPPDAPAEELKAAFTSAISRVTTKWEQAPKSFFWKPVVKIVIHPGGLVHYAKAKDLADVWSVPVNTEYELE